MKKNIFILFALLASFLPVHAENGVKVGKTYIPQGGIGTIDIELVNDDYELTACDITLTLPEGLSFVLNDKGIPTSAKTGRMNDESFTVSSAMQTERAAKFICYSNLKLPFADTSGTLLKVYVKADAELAIGTELTAALSEIEFTTTSSEAILFDNATFDIEIAENRVLLDELSTTMPEAAEGVNVRVNRTLAANVWNTLVLPFDMTAEQVKAAFGNDVQLADFTGVDTEADADENIVGMTVNFQAITAIEANHPCLIKVSEAMNSFTVDGVDVEAEDEPSVDCDEIVVKVGGKKYYYYNSFVGTYVENTEVPELSLFLNGNKFWYSTGATKMKAFRAYFSFYDVLTEVLEAESKIRFVVDDEVTSIDGIPSAADKMGAVYNLNGQLIGFDIDVNSLPAGIYVKDGQKIVVK